MVKTKSGDLRATACGGEEDLKHVEILKSHL